MFIVVAYDVADNKRLLKVAKIMEDYGTRVQYSVFEIHADGAILREIMRRVSGVLEEKEDSVRFYPLCKNCERKTEIIGNPVYVTPPADVTVF